MILALSTAAQQRVEVITVALIIFLERYAILWLAAAVTVLVLSVWTGLLGRLSHAAGISYLPSALFAVAFLFVLVMLVHFSMTISRLAYQNTALAQRLALLQERLDDRDQEQDLARGGAQARDGALLDGEPRQSSTVSAGNSIEERASAET